MLVPGCVDDGVARRRENTETLARLQAKKLILTEIFFWAQQLVAAFTC
jgi:hypothetical protein